MFVRDFIKHVPSYLVRDLERCIKETSTKQLYTTIDNDCSILAMYPFNSKKYFHATFDRRADVQNSEPEAQDYHLLSSRYLVTFSPYFMCLELTARSANNDIRVDGGILANLMTRSGLYETWKTGGRIVLDDNPEPSFKWTFDQQEW